MLYLSQAIGRPVLDANGEPLGKVDDLIVALGGRCPPVSGPAATIPVTIDLIDHTHGDGRCVALLLGRSVR